MVNEKIRIENSRVDLITNCQKDFIPETKPCQVSLKNLGSASSFSGTSKEGGFDFRIFTWDT